MPLLLNLSTILATAKEVFGAGHALYIYVQKLRQAARQSDEWTDAHEAAFERELELAALDPAWQPRQK